MSGRYPPAVLDHFEHPRNVGSFPAGEPGVRRGQAGSLDGADLVRIELRVDAGRVAEARFRAFGCGWAIAAASLATERVRGLALAEAARVDGPTLGSALGFPPERARFAELAAQALKAALAGPITEG